MSRARHRHTRTIAAAAAATLSVALVGQGVVTATAAPTTSGAATAEGSPAAGDPHDHLPDLDTRATRSAAPSSTQRSAAADDGRSPSARSATGRGTITWNRFGSVETMTPTSAKGDLSAGLGKDPEAAARAFLDKERSTFGLTSADIADMEHVATNRIGSSDVVMLRQQIDGLAAGLDGLVVVAVDGGTARYVNSSLAPTSSTARRAPAAAGMTPEKALGHAAKNIGHPATGIAKVSSRSASASSSWTTLTATGLQGQQQVKKVAVPVPGGAARTAYHVVTRVGADEGYSVYVDAADGSIIARESLVDFDSDNPSWSVFTGTPDAETSDTRSIWCFTAAAGCDEAVGNAASAFGWDVDPATKLSTGTTNGNNAYTGERWRSGGPVTPATSKPERDYVFPFTAQWTKKACDPANYTSPERNDIDAATTNLFAMHNRMHDWSYNLGFTETAWNMQRDNGTKGGKAGDPELGYSQSGAQSGSRNNANQGTPPDGISGYSNMYLWQPLAGSFYAPCVDGDYDMSVIGHEYGHAISNRMAGGPDAGLSGLQAGAMGESWSDLMATEYLQEWGYTPVSKQATPMGGYVTGNPDRGIRNYNFSDSPLNYSNVGYDLTGPQVPADGEIWSATQSDIRASFMDRYGSGDAATQAACASGAKAVDTCPGNRRWMQLVFDAWLLMPRGTVSMVDARNAMLAADLLRFGGANQDLLWNGFADRGLGRDAASASSSTTAPTPSFASAYAKNATLRLSPTDEDGRPVAGAKVYVGEYTARSRPVADTDAASDLGESFEVVPGERTYTVTAPGKAQTVVTLTAKDNQRRDLPVKMRDNLASTAAGATISGDGDGVDNLVDGDEDTTGATPANPTSEQKRYTVDLAGGRQKIRRVQVSALGAPSSGVSRNRFQNLRQFKVLTCDAKGKVTCEEDADYRVTYTSPKDAFPGDVPRPVAPELKMRSFDIPQTSATHVRLEVVANQCQGGEQFAGEQDGDPDNDTDCTTAYAGSSVIATTEFQVMRR
ncbi:peptidase M36 fungalysin [Janibacter hoylei PVAS-1]|uniref:Peptidase M36 n=1 Tax=Janibacter hoylei PVAS-1 TaxID=1210046 RepID=K1DX33_9MICO|nr:M36 family metallopeptidase [Janibacter hoylei]EKA60954.1 peptidase M36 fungalysin [Janibacter hoylei PVAS-1]RWU83002.1 peptidase M36 [Janibacter hoylei PVAS-1]